MPLRQYRACVVDSLGVGITCVLYHSSMCTRHPNLVSSAFYAIPIFHIINLLVISSYTPESPAPSPPSAVSVSQNGLDSVLVSWTPPSGEPNVTGYIIYYWNYVCDYYYFEWRYSENVEATATTATITGLIAGATYYITMMTTSSTLPSSLTRGSRWIVTIGTINILT